MLPTMFIFQHDAFDLLKLNIKHVAKGNNIQTTQAPKSLVPYKTFFALAVPISSAPPLGLPQVSFFSVRSTWSCALPQLHHSLKSSASSSSMDHLVDPILWHFSALFSYPLFHGCPWTFFETWIHHHLSLKHIVDFHNNLVVGEVGSLKVRQIDLCKGA